MCDPMLSNNLPVTAFLRDHLRDDSYTGAVFVGAILKLPYEIKDLPNGVSILRGLLVTIWNGSFTKDDVLLKAREEEINALVGGFK